MQIKMKNRWHKYDINWPRSRNGHEFGKNKQHLSNIWISIGEKVKQHFKQDFKTVRFFFKFPFIRVRHI